MLKSELETRLKKACEIEYKEDAATLLEIINHVDTAYATDLDLYSIILEEVTGYFEDDREIDSVIGIIQNRASIYIYISENY